MGKRVAEGAVVGEERGGKGGCGGGEERGGKGGVECCEGEGPIEIQAAEWFRDSSVTRSFKAHLVVLWWKACGELEQSMQQSLDLTACKENTA